MFATMPKTMAAALTAVILTVAAAPSSATALGVADVSASSWSNASAIQASINQIQTALNQISSTQSKFAAAQTALQAASQVNQSSALAASSSAAALVGADIAAAVLSEKTSQAQSELASYASEEQNKQTRSILGLLEK